jgi:hypothetical protein
MKKLKLNAVDLGAKEILSRSQLKNVFGVVNGSDVEYYGCNDKTVKCVSHDPYITVGYCDSGANQSCVCRYENTIHYAEECFRTS